MTDEAFERAILEMTETLWRICCSQLRQKADREDAVQEALKKAWEKRKLLKDQAALKPWLARILINECHNIQRKSKRLIPVEELPPPAPPNQEDGLMRELILSLPEKYRMPVVLMLMEGMSAQETARALRIPQGTVHSRMHRAREILRTQWEEAQKE